MIPYDPAGPTATADPDSFSARLRLDGASATERLGNDIAMALAPGDLVGLSGDLGAGKTALARAILRTLAGDPGLEVPSPTFALAIPYALAAVTVLHADLYRIDEEEDLRELGLEDDPDAVLLVEWPERGGGFDRESRLTCRLEGAGDSRDVHVDALGPVAGRLRRSLRIREFLDAASMGDASRSALHGDASGRAYERLGGAGLLVMKVPLSVGTPQDPYGVAARRAPSIEAFIAIDRLLREHGFRAPRIERSDVEAGLLLVEDLGEEGIAPGGEPLAERYLAVAECLAAKDAIRWPSHAPLDGGSYAIRAYDRSVLEVELSLYLEWRGAAARDAPPLGARARGEFFALWGPHLDRVVSRPRTLVLRDVHSPNILWQEKAEGLDRIGLIDFQDALIGDPAYDLASLALDARVTVPQALESAIVDRYVACRRNLVEDFDEDGLRLAFAILGAQRASKIIGIFRRLHRHEGRSSYLAHLPRVEAYLGRCLAHPALSELRAWYGEDRG